MNTATGGIGTTYTSIGWSSKQWR